VPFLWLLPHKVNSKPVSQKKDKLDNTLFFHSPSVSNKWLFAWTKWMKNQSTSHHQDTIKLKKKSKDFWKKSDINPNKFHSSQFQDGTETIC
jgi:hypothetical protein